MYTEPATFQPVISNKEYRYNIYMTVLRIRIALMGIRTLYSTYFGKFIIRLWICGGLIKIFNALIWNSLGTEKTSPR